MKRVVSLLIMLFMVVSLVLPISTINHNNVIKKEMKIVRLADIKCEMPVIEAKEIVKEVDPIEVAIQEMQKEMSSIESIEDKQEWFIAYKEIVDKYSHIIDPPETIYDYFEDEELDLLFRVVQAEVGDEWEFIHKVNVVNVIFNRLYSNQRNFKEQDTLSKVLTASQFRTIKNGDYKKVNVSDVTILACEYAFRFEDTTDGCLAFRSDKNAPDRWCKWTKQFTDEAHYFYK